MSAARRLLAWLWAAGWVRWQLTRVKGARLVSGRPAALAGSDYHLAPVETPVEGLDYDPDELPDELIARLELMRGELRHRQPRLARPVISRGARRRRVASLAIAAILGVGAVGAGAAALVTGSTGVPGVDRLLGIYESKLDDPTRSNSARGAPGSAVQPRGDAPSASIEVGGDGLPMLVSSSYMARDGRVCTALTAVEGPTRGPIGTVTCVSPSSLAASLGRRGGVVLAVHADDGRVIVRGFVSGDVATLNGRGPYGPLDVQLETWRPGIPGVESLKPFLALGDVQLRGPGRGASGPDPLRFLDPAAYTFSAVMDDGKQVPIMR